MSFMQSLSRARGATGRGLDSRPCMASMTTRRRSARRSSPTPRTGSELDPVPLDGPRSKAELRRRGRRHHHRRRDRRPGRAEALRGGAGAGLPVHRPPALPVLHPVRADRGRRDVRPRRRRLVDLRRVVARRAPARSTPRTRRCAGSPTWPACRRRPAGSSCRAARSATCPRSSRPARSARARHAGPAGPAPRPLARRRDAAPTPRSSRPARSWTPSFVGVEADDARRLTGTALREVLAGRRARDASSPSSPPRGTTNFGIVDDLASVAEVCREYGIWFHVDGAYGGAGLAAPSVRHLFAGIEHCRLLHRRPAQVAVRAVRLLRPALPRAGPGPGRAHPARRATSTSSPTRPTGTRPTTPSA